MPIRLIQPEPPLDINDYHLLNGFRLIETSTRERISQDRQSRERFLPILEGARSLRQKARRAIYPYRSKLFPMILEDKRLHYIGSEREAHFGVHTMKDVMPRVQLFIPCEAALWWKKKPSSWIDLCYELEALLQVIKGRRLGPKSRHIIPILRFNTNDLLWETEAIFVGFVRTGDAIQLALSEDGFSRTPP